MTQLGLDFDAPSPRRRRTAALESFHVRSHILPEEALVGERRAQRQDALILAVFRARPGQHLTPWEVFAILAEERICNGRKGAAPLITSVRRGITNLTARELLIHHDKDRRPGPCGAKESTWSLA